MLEGIEVKTDSMVNNSGMSDAPEKAVNGQSETVRDLRSKTAFIFRKSVTDDGSTAVEIVSQEGDFGRRIKDPILGLLS